MLATGKDLISVKVNKSGLTGIKGIIPVREHGMFLGILREFQKEILSVMNNNDNEDGDESGDETSDAENTNDYVSFSIETFKPVITRLKHKASESVFAGTPIIADADF